LIPADLGRAAAVETFVRDYRAQKLVVGARFRCREAGVEIHASRGILPVTALKELAQRFDAVLVLSHHDAAA
jgi:hypothetical protein